MFRDNLDGKGIYFIENWKKIYVTENEKDLLLNGCKYENWEVIETPEYLEKIENEEKQKDINNLKELTKKSIENLAKYDAVNRMYEASELKTHELTLLENKGQELLEEITIAKTNAIEKYGIEVLEELL